MRVDRQTDRQTDKQTDILITVLRTLSGGEVIIRPTTVSTLWVS